ncbi:hypothetical protein Tco_1072191 [Tanacetum coccineum]
MFFFFLLLYAGISEDASPHVQEAAPAPDAQPLVADAGADKVASDGNVDPYYDARVGNTARDVLERDLLPLSSDLITSLILMTKVLEVSLLLTLKTLGKKFMESILCAQQTQTIKKQSANLRQQNESTVRANEEVYRNERDTLAIEKENIKEELAETKSQLEHRGRQAEEIQGSITSFFQSDFTPLVRRLLKSGEFNRAFTGVLNTTISVGVERNQETPGDLATEDRLSPKIKMFLIPVIGRYQQRFEASKVLDYLSRIVASYTDVAEVILKDIDNDVDYHEVGSIMDLVLGREAYGFHVLLFVRIMFGSAGSSRAVKDSLFIVTTARASMNYYCQETPGNLATRDHLSPKVKMFLILVIGRLRMDRTDEEFRELSQRVAGFIPDAKQKFDRVVAAFPDTTFPFFDKMSRLIWAWPIEPVWSSSTRTTSRLWPAY